MTRPKPKPSVDLVPTAREVRWLAQIACHGPQSSEFLFELTRDTHRCKDTALRRLQALRDAEYLRLPPQQDQISKANFNPNVYDLTRRSQLHLRGLSYLPTVRPTGHWWHAFVTASVTSAISIETNRRGYSYIPAHEILNRSAATLAIPMGQRQLIPDQLFAINYGGIFRSFVLEVDRGTEPYRSQAARKSVERMIGTYAKLSAKDALRRHYGLRAPLIILLLFTAPERAARSLEILETLPASFAPFVLVKVVPSGFPRFETILDAVSTLWRRSGNAAFDVFSSNK